MHCIACAGFHGYSGFGLDKPVTLRLFFGLEIPESVKQRLLSIQRPIIGARWQRADQLHLTLAFLGNLEAHQLPGVRQAARNLPVNPFDLTVSGIGCFGDPDHPKSLWAGVQPVEELTELHEALNLRLAACGLGQEKRTFRPHITLSRFKKEPGSVREVLRAHQEVHAGTFSVNRIALFQSIPSSQGSVYSVLDRFPFH